MRPQYQINNIKNIWLEKYEKNYLSFYCIVLVHSRLVSGAFILTTVIIANSTNKPNFCRHSNSSSPLWTHYIISTQDMVRRSHNLYLHSGVHPSSCYGFHKDAFLTSPDKKIEGRGLDLNWVAIPEFIFEDWEKSQNTSVRITNL